MATLTVVETAGFGGGATDVGYETAAGGGDEFQNTGKEFVIIDNADASPTTVSAAVQANAQSLNVSGITKDVTVPATTTGMMGPFDTRYYNDSNGRVQLTYTSVTSLNVAVVRIVEPFGR